MPSDPGKTGAELPFAQMMGQAKNAAEEFTKMFATLKRPALPDSEALLTAIDATLRRSRRPTLYRGEVPPPVGG